MMDDINAVHRAGRDDRECDRRRLRGHDLRHAVANVIVGNRGIDSLFGYGGDDVIAAGAGSAPIIAPGDVLRNEVANSIALDGSFTR